MTTQTLFLTRWRGILAAAILAAVPLCLPAAEEDPASAARDALQAVSASTQISTNAEVELRKTQESIEKLRRELEARSAQNSEALTTSLRLIETSMGRMHERHMEAVQSSNRAILTVAGVFAAVGIIGLIFILILLARALGRFSEIAMNAAPRAQLLGTGQSGGLLGSGEGPGNRQGSAEEASGRFQGAIDQLQKRILELEQSAQASSTAGTRSRAALAKPADGSNIEPLMPEDTTSGATPEVEPPASRSTVLLGKGQALLNLDATETAMECFDEVLHLEPNNAEALVKRGMAFEKMQDWENALENYDRAITADSSMTVAYLYRGGVCNRLHRYREALESYEQALLTEKSSRAS